MTPNEGTVESKLRGAARSDVSAASAEAARRLAERAADADLIDVAYAFTDSPFGRFLVAGTAKGLVRLAFQPEPVEEVLNDLARRVSPRVMESPGALDEVRRELDEYFEGDRHSFDIPLDWRLTHGFSERVLRATAKIPYGGVSTYRDVATRAGNPRAMRAAGNALGSNPLPIVVPCHRVVRTGGSIGNYGGGPDMKRALLTLEGALGDED
jgi:methylated-DNA-[protein]-cysteine S-methyltransferase